MPSSDLVSIAMDGWCFFSRRALIEAELGRLSFYPSDRQREALMCCQARELACLLPQGRA